MTPEEKLEIVQSVMIALSANSLRIDQLTLVEAFGKDDFFELNKGRKINASKLASYIYDIQCASDIRELKNGLRRVNSEISIINERLSKLIAGGGGGGGTVAAQVEFSHIVHDVVEHQQTSTKNGKLVFNSTTGRFLWEVAETRLEPKLVYYVTSTMEELAGTSPICGQIYICDVHTYIGVYGGLSELNKTII